MIDRHLRVVMIEGKMRPDVEQFQPLPALLSLALVAVHGASFAAGFQLFVQNVSGLGTAYAGQAANAEDASVTFFNVAGLAELEGRDAVLALPVLRPDTRFSTSASCSPYAGVGAGTSACPFGASGNLGHAFGGEGGNGGHLASLLTGYLSYELVPQRLWFGFGVNEPFGSTTDWDADWMGRFHSIRSRITTVNVNPAVAWKIKNTFAAGLGLNVQKISAELSNAVSYRAAALQSGIPGVIAATPPGAEGAATIEGDDIGWGWNAGLTVSLPSATRVGVAYRSRIRYRLDGTVRFGDRPLALAAAPALADGDVAADVKLPDTLAIAVAQQLGSQLRLVADWTRTGWNSIQDLSVVRTSGPLAGQTLSTTALRFKNTWRAAVGANYQLSNVKLRVGLAYDRSAVQDQFRTPRLPDADRIWVAVGTQWKIASPGFTIDVGYAYVRLKDASSNLPNRDGANIPPRGSLVGTYRANVHIVGFQGSWSF